MLYKTKSGTSPKQMRWLYLALPPLVTALIGYLLLPGGEYFLIPLGVVGITYWGILEEHGSRPRIVVAAGQPASAVWPKIGDGLCSRR